MGIHLDGTRVRQNFTRGAALNDTRRAAGNIERDKGIVRVEGNTLSFTSTATIADSGNGLGGMVVGRPFLVSGATLNANNRLFLPTAVAAGSLTVEPALVATDTGTSVTEVRMA